MWDDITIGKRNLVNNNHYLCSACKVFNIGLENVSANSEEYWISKCILDTGMVVCKDTEEGKLITKMIEEKTKPKLFQKRLDAMILKRMPVNKLYASIQNMQVEYFDKGVEANQKEIQTAMGLRGRGMRLTPDM
jgi:hypothetical protein